MRKESGYHILRVAMGITFAWIGVLIFKEPVFWGGFLQPWAAGLLPVPIKEAMIGTAFLDLGIGLLLLADVYTWVVATIGAVHLAIILIVSGIDSITVRDIGLLGAAVSLAWTDAPEWLKMKFRKHQT
jgi:uncharacterized membrane protein YphA (DoxX/SURF4 family)